MAVLWSFAFTNYDFRSYISDRKNSVISTLWILLFHLNTTVVLLVFIVSLFVCPLSVIDNTLTAPPTPTNISVNLIPSTSIASTTTTSNTSSTVSSSAPSPPCPHAANLMAAAHCEAVIGGTPKGTRKRSVEANRSISINKPMGFYHSSSEDQSVNGNVKLLVAFSQ